MEPSGIFYNSAGRLRSGWRMAIFTAAYLLLLIVLGYGLRALLLIGHAVAPGFVTRAALGDYLIDMASRLLLLLTAVLAGWGCLKLLEDLPLRALGFALHSNWLRDFLIGSLIGIVSLALAIGIEGVAKGVSFSLAPSLTFGALGKSLLLACLLFIVAGASEEALFRGYPLQTMARSHIAWVAIVLTAVFFGVAHLKNPNVEGWAFLQTPFGGMFKRVGWGFMNTVLAGVWLAVAYLRTRSLWFPLGVHWSWNWLMGSILGLPVSGIYGFARSSLLHANDLGPAWLTGGSYGPEGGAACTIALLVSTIFIWRTRLVSATEEMRRLTDEENPKEKVLSLESGV